MLEGLERGSVVASGGKGGEPALAVISVSPARERSFAIAVVAALALHFVAFGAMVGTTMVDILIAEEEEPKLPELPRPDDPDEFEDAVVELDAAALLALREEPGPEEAAETGEPVRVDPIENDPIGYAKTSPDQESEETPEGAILIGERNTLAAAELAPVKENGPELPTQKGEDPLRNERDLFNSDFSPGEEEGRAAPENVDPEEVAGDPAAAAANPTTPVETGQPVQEQGRAKEDLLESRDTVEVPVEEGVQEEKEETLPRRKENEREAEVTRKGENGQSQEPIREQMKNGGFRTESRKTRMEGTISRQGRSSLKVEATALGKYKARVNRMIETEWQRRCVMHRDHVLPGILTLRFYVDKDGKVSGLRYLDVFQASAMQKGFTMKAVQQPRLPVMPEEVLKELEGEPLEFHINFRF
ncbi:MAG: hypothetical protein HRU37_05180 [Roseibacillus sp.]|nr:hypothetical protein [Roseibacillus sp.]